MHDEPAKRDDSLDRLTSRIAELEGELEFRSECLNDAMKFQEGYEQAVRDIFSTFITELRVD